MTQLHPEELFELERQASLTESERALRDQHLASCRACRIEHGLRADFAREPLHGGDDRALIERAVGGALANLAAPRRSTGPRKAAVLAAAGVLVAGLAAAAAHRSAGGGAAAPPARAAVPALPIVEPAKPSHAPLPAPSALLSAAPAPRIEHAPSSDLPPATNTATVGPSAAELFGRANAARRTGELTDAAALYRKLLDQFADSREAQTSSIILGRLLLDNGDSASEALALFERYTRVAPAGNLAEEALLGRAEALARLGRPADELEAWRTLLQRFPQTAQRERAQARAATLSTPL